MDLMRQIDGYCERVGPEFWAEPVNAATNLAFLVAALVMGLRLRGSGLGLGWVLAGCLALIGVGSALFHTYATLWAVMLDVLGILAFTLVYIFAANRVFWGLSPVAAAIGALLFIPYAQLLAPLFAPVLGSSASYVPLPILIGLYAILLVRRAPRTAAGLGLGAAVLCVSIAFRAADLPLCEDWPQGTHFVWHVLNAVMLGWMIEVYRRHRLAS